MCYPPPPPFPPSGLPPRAFPPLVCGAPPKWSKANKRWRSTIPLWSPYRDDRQWFAAWELGRRLVLTGFLIAVPPDGEGNEHIRAVVAFVLAGVALVVGEVARPHRDPWIYWIYRAVSDPSSEL